MPVPYSGEAGAGRSSTTLAASATSLTSGVSSAAEPTAHTAPSGAPAKSNCRLTSSAYSGGARAALGNAVADCDGEEDAVADALCVHDSDGEAVGALERDCDCEDEEEDEGEPVVLTDGEPVDAADGEEDEEGDDEPDAAAVREPEALADWEALCKSEEAMFGHKRRQSKSMGAWK
jgi:hypothetical protein